MNKTLRNRALKDSIKLIVADYKGEDWSTPDGHFAVAYDIYEGYRVKKNQRTIDGKPNLELAIGDLSTHMPADVLNDAPEGCTKLTAVDSPVDYIVNNDYLDLILNIFPAAIIKVAANGNWYSPVALFDKDKLVGIVCPLKG